MKSDTTYTCRWKYKKKNGDWITVSGSVTNLAASGVDSKMVDYFVDKYTGLKDDYSLGEFEDYVKELRK